MHRFSLYFIFIVFFPAIYSCDALKEDSIEKENNVIAFDKDWRFYRGEAIGAEQYDFADSSWRIVELPHDWSIEDLPGTGSPFHPEAISGVSGGFTVGGTGWYRKTFHVEQKDRGKAIYLQFDGVYMNADFWLNGVHLGNYPYGYSSFWFDISGLVSFNSANVIAVEVKNEGRNSRWYSGSGIYRHVWLRIVDQVHVAPWGVYVTTPEIEPEYATVKVKTKVLNKGESQEIQVKTVIRDNSGKIVAESAAASEIDSAATFEFDQELLVDYPALWSIDNPNLYAAVTEVYAGDKLCDRTETTFGIRSISFDAENGFLLNGQPVELKGGCVHHDNGPLGAKAYDRAEERKVELLKASGFNAVRTAHNPPSPAFLDACDRLGMLVIDEAFDTWSERKNRQDYHLYFNNWWRRDLENLVLRDRNHPSIIMWSAGNEIPNRHKPEVAQLSKQLSDFIRNLDPTRPATSGVNGAAEDKDSLFATIDVAGYNYAPERYVVDHERVPSRIIYGSESFPNEAFDYWKAVEDYSWVIGDFVWTAWDYLGEASIGWLGFPQKKEFFPWNLAWCGDIDICGWKRPQSYYRDALWSDDPQISVFVKPPTPTFEQTNPNQEEWSRWEWDDVVDAWTWPGQEGKTLEVNVYSSCDEAELFLNGKSLGKKPSGRDAKLKTVWLAPYQPGVLRAVGYVNGKDMASAVLKTAGKPEKIKLAADRKRIKTGVQDLSYITVELVDANGVIVPHAENLVKFEIDGPGVIVGVGNAKPTSTESYTAPQRKLWRGRALAIVKAGDDPGRIVFKATIDGVGTEKIVLTSYR